MSTNIIILSLVFLVTLASGANLGREKLEQLIFSKNTELIKNQDDRPPRLLLLTTNPKLAADLLKRSSASDISQFDLYQPHLVSVAANDNTNKSSSYIKIPEQIQTVIGLIRLLTDVGIPGWSSAEIGLSLIAGEFDVFKLPFRSEVNNTFEAQNTSNNIDELVVEPTDPSEIEPIDE